MRLLRYLLAAALLLSLLSGFTIIEPGEVGVVRRFGGVLDEKPGPGLYTGLPWGIDQVTKVQVQRVRSVTVGFAPERAEDLILATPSGQLLTGDHNLVNIRAVVNYVVRPDEVELFAFQQDAARDLVARTAEGVLAEWVASQNVDRILLEGKSARLAGGGRSLVESLVRDTQAQLEGYRLGVEVTNAEVDYLNPPDEVRDAFNQVMQAETEIATKENQARQDKAQRVQEAQAEAYRTRKLAQADARAVTLLARAEADNFRKRLRQYRELGRDNPYYLNAVWWDEISRLYARMKANGRIDLLDHHLGRDGLDITQVPLMPRK